MKKMNTCESSIPWRINWIQKFNVLKIFSLLFFVIGSLNIASATTYSEPDMSQTTQQKKTVKGTVTDESGEAIPGVSVIVKGTSVGQITDMDGKYSLEVPGSSTTLIFSFVGMKTVEEVIGDRTDINIVLASETIGVDEVVVTALGIQRDKKALTYSSQQITGEEMMKARDINFMNSLSGKTAGLEIKKSVSGAGGSTKTILRGNKSLSQSSDPLYVIDGIPMVNRKNGQSGMWGGTDQGDGLSQINPDDIESISILKGSNAAILYGSQGANGVIMINTKKGKAGKTNVSFSSSTIFENIIETPELQFDYGSEGGAKESWSYTKGNYASNYVEDFFQTGSNLVNTLSISGGNDKTTAYFSYGNTSAKGVIPNNEYQKNNVTFQQSTKLLNDRMSIRSNVMLTSEKTKNRNTAGYYLNPLTGLYFFPRNGAVPLSSTDGSTKDFAYFKDNYDRFDVGRNMYLQNWHVADHHQSNPYWLINKQPKEDITKRVIASVTLDYEITKNLKFQARGSYDYSEKSFEQKFYAGGNSTNISENGRWSYQKYNDELAYTDAIFTYNNKFGNFSLNGVLGASYQQSVYGKGVSVDNGTNSLFYANEFNFQNLPTNVQVSSIYAGKVIKEGVFANAQLGYKDMIYLDLSGRNDWSSTLAGTGNQSYFYPSIGLSGIVSQMIDLPDFLSFAKLRTSYSTVANEVPFNRVDPQNTITASGGVSRNTQKPFTNLKPEMIRSLEVGADLRFFNGRAGIDFTYYNINSQDQFITLPAPSGSGYTYYYINAGEIVNKGIELTVTAEPVKSNDFSWNTALNFSKNTNEIVELVPEFADKKIEYGSSEGYSTYVIAGGSFGDLYGYKFKRNDAGQIMLDETTGKPLKTADREYMGNLEPDFSLGWNNNLSYKQFSLSFLINAKFGGKCFSQTEAMLDGYGVSKRSGDARENGGVEINAIKGSTAVTKIDPLLYYTTVGDRNGIAEAYVYDRTNIRLTQLALTYDFDVKKLDLPIKAASISAVGQNLLFLYKKAPFDPELTMSTDMNSQSLDNFNVPSTRTFGFNLKVTF